MQRTGPADLLVIAHANICGLANKCRQVTGLLESADLNVLALTEIHLNNGENKPIISGYRSLAWGTRGVKAIKIGQVAIIVAYSPVDSEKVEVKKEFYM